MKDLSEKLKSQIEEVENLVILLDGDENEEHNLVSQAVYKLNVIISSKLTGHKNSKN